MVSEITQWIMELTRAYGQLSVLIGVMIEQIIVPIPSPLIIMGAGAILTLHGLSIPNAFLKILWVIILPGAIASILDSYIGYRSNLRKSCDSFRFGGDKRLNFNVDRYGHGLWIPLL